ncbi:MAG: single-stranded DNA-binding protein [Anaerovoracaceae bacterium]
MNISVLIGRLTRDPEIRYTEGGNLAIANFSIAVDRIAKQGEEKKTDFIRITAFGKQAENCEKFLTKGKLVGVEGRIQTDSYVNKEGQKVFTTDIVASRVQFLEWGEKKEELVRLVSEEEINPNTQNNLEVEDEDKELSEMCDELEAAVIESGAI